MKRLRLVLVVFATVFSLGVAGAPAAQASEHGNTCGTWSHASKSGTACVFLNNQAIGGISARVRFSFSGNMSNNAIYAEFDYVRLLLNGVVVKSNNTNQNVTVGQTISTPGSTSCGTFKATARYRFLHSVGGPGLVPDGHTSGWVVRTTGGFNLCGS